MTDKKRFRISFEVELTDTQMDVFKAEFGRQFPDLKSLLIEPAVSDDAVSNLLSLGRETDLDIDPDRVLDCAIGELKQVAVVGWDKDDVLYTAASTPHGGDLLVLAEGLKRRVLEKCFTPG